MSIERTAKVGSYYTISYFLSDISFIIVFIYQMQDNFASLNSLTTRLNNVQEARYELATIRSHVNFFSQYWS